MKCQMCICSLVFRISHHGCGDLDSNSNLNYMFQRLQSKFSTSTSVSDCTIYALILIFKENVFLCVDFRTQINTLER